jgi:hypothetical protein
MPFNVGPMELLVLLILIAVVAGVVIAIGRRV